MHWKFIGLMLLGMSLVGCTGPDPLKDDFGESVRHMIRVQTNSPAPESGAGLDGERAERTLLDYRGTESGGAVRPSGGSVSSGAM